MEEVTKQDECCGGGRCSGVCMNMHKYCGRRHCLLRIILAIFVIGVIFALGFTAGVCASYRYSQEGYRGHFNMMYQGGGGGWGNFPGGADSAGNVRVMYRMMGQPTAQTPVAPVDAQVPF